MGTIYGIFWSHRKGRLMCHPLKDEGGWVVSNMWWRDIGVELR